MLFENFENNGYVILKSFYSNADLNSMLDEINTVGKFIYGNFFYDQAWEENPEKQQRLYRVLRYLTSLRIFSGLEKNIELCHKLGLKLPAVMNSCNIRMDTPTNQSLFHWHQDITYLLGSLNALTFWIPLCDVNTQTGTVELLPRSHNKGIYPYKITTQNKITSKSLLSPTDIVLEKEPEGGLVLEARKGDLVVFNQTLLHRSTPNCSQVTRWTVQLRYADLLSEQFCNDNYPFGDVTNINFTNYIDYINYEKY